MALRLTPPRHNPAADFEQLKKTSQCLLNDPAGSPEWHRGPGQITIPRSAVDVLWALIIGLLRHRVELIILLGLVGMNSACIETIDNYGELLCDQQHPCKGSLTCLDGRCAVPPDKLSCASDADCKKLGGGLCNLADNRCYGCLTDTDCNGGRCNDLYFCQPCLEHCDCGPGGFCDVSGAVYYCRFSSEPEACPTFGKESDAATQD